MATTKVAKPINPEEVRTAIKKLAAHRFHARMNQVDGEQAHSILEEIWPIIQELCLIADACEAQMIQVKS